MKAIVQTEYGSADVLQLKEVEKPSAKDNEIQVRIYATSVTAAHCAMRQGPHFLVGYLLVSQDQKARYQGLILPERLQQ